MSDDGKVPTVTEVELQESIRRAKRTCSICARRVPIGKALPLCDPCEATARVAGKQAAERDRQEREGWTQERGRWS